MRKWFFLFALILFSTNANAQVLQNFIIEGRYFYGPSGRGPITGVCTDGRYLYLTENFDSLKIFDLTWPNFIEHEIGSCYTYGVDHLFTDGNILIGTGVANWRGFTIFDISDPSNPILLSHGGGSDVIAHPKIVGNYLFAPFWNDNPGECGIRSYNITDPYHPILADNYWPPGFMWYSGFDLEISGTVAYMTSWPEVDEPVLLLDISHPDSIYGLGTLSGAGGTVKKYGNNLIIGSPLQFGTAPIAIYNIDDPRNPTLSETIDVTLPNSWSMDVMNGLLYVSWLNNMLLLDIGGFSSAESLAYYNLPAVPDSSYISIPQTAVNGSLVYCAFGNNGLYVLRYTGPMPINTGDINSSGDLNGLDVVYLVSYLKGIGPAPQEPRERGDANGDCAINGIDVIYLVNYFKGQGPEPIRAFCYGH